MKNPTFRERIHYRFDNFITRGGIRIFSLLVLLFMILFVMIGAFRFGMKMLGAKAQWEGGLGQQLYITFLEMTDPGNMAQDIQSTLLMKIPGIIAGIVGIVMLSVLIAFITTALIERMEALRKGHSRVIEDDHTLILGWDPQRVVEILRELIIANESEDDPSVVILADVSKVQMDDHLNLVLPNRKNTRVITRSGSVSSLTNLYVASVETCKSVIVLASAREEASLEEKNLSDAQTIKAVLALSSACKAEQKQLNIVAEIFNQHHYEILQSNCPHRIEVVSANEILAKIMVQTSRSVGLSVVYSEILSFDGCEMYFHGADWNGISFGQAQFHFPDGVPMGIRKANGDILINPPIEEILDQDDEVLILAQDDSTIDFQPSLAAVSNELPLNSDRLKQVIENELIIGWNRKGPAIVAEYAEYVKDGSQIDVIVKNPQKSVIHEIQHLNDSLEGLQVQLINQDPLKAQTLIDVNPGKRDNIIILSGGEHQDPEKSDAQTILILLLLRRILHEHPDETVRTRLITEVMDSANRGLIAQVGVKDFIISNQFISMLLAQMSEELDIKLVYDQLFEEDGSEIYLKPACLYFESIPEEVSFADCMAIAQKRKEICIGIKVQKDEQNEHLNFGVSLVPEKNTKYVLRPNDCLIVVAEDES